MPKRKVILITDGDRAAQATVEEAARQVGGRCISASAGNPTPLSGEEIVEMIRSAKHDPVLVMFDDCGWNQKGRGERALEYVANHPDIEVLGVIAVASDSRKVYGTPVDVALDQDGNIVHHRVDKDGHELHREPLRIYGDTVDVLNRIEVPIVVGIGDIGKMEDHDRAEWGAPVTTKAVELILQHANGEWC